MATVRHPLRYAKYTFREQSGYVIHPDMGNSAQRLVALGHTAFLNSWSNGEVHLHEESEEIYFLLHGELWVLVADSLLTLRPHEILMIKPQVPHAVVKGNGLIEHIGIRAPALGDKRNVGKIPLTTSSIIESERGMRAEWGFRASLLSPEYHNCWLIGAGSARFAARHIALAYLNFPTEDAANAGLGTRHRLHYHQRSWEYYCVLAGAKVLQIEDELVSVQAGEILAVPPQVSHRLYSRQAPFEGFTFRVPLVLDDKVEP